MDRPRVEAAVRELLAGLGFDPDDDALEVTAEKTAEAFDDALTSGYRETPAEALGKGFPVKSDGPVIATDIPLLFVCPHHLMPARGVVHLAFVPKERAPGLARITRLVDTLSRRLVLQEDLTDDLAGALYETLDAKASLVIVEAVHTCVALEDFARRDATFITRASRGRNVASLEARIDARVRGSWATSASKPVP